MNVYILVNLRTQRDQFFQFYERNLQLLEESRSLSHV
jgi:hypothetical protein